MTHWTATRQELLRRLWPQNISTDEIAREFGLSRGVIEKYGRNVLKLGGRTHVRSNGGSNQGETKQTVEAKMRQDIAFQARMRAAIRLKLESPRIGIVEEPGTMRPILFEAPNPFGSATGQWT